MADALAYLVAYARSCDKAPSRGSDKWENAVRSDLAELDRLRTRVAELESAASPDDAHTSTARHTEWLTVGTEDGDEGAETFETKDEAQRAADQWRRGGMTNVYVERHDVATTRTVSTTTRTTDWKAEQ